MSSSRLSGATSPRVNGRTCGPAPKDMVAVLP
jgi:hypothetical protein